MFERFFRSKPKSVEKLATGLDPKRTYLAGVLMRFDEEFSDAISFASELKPSYSPRPIPKFASESERGGFAALSVALGMAADAMGAQGKLMVGTERASIFEGAVGISYGMFILNLLLRYLKDDSVEVDHKLLGSYAAHFAECYVYLDDAKRKELSKKGLEIYRDMIESDHQNLKDWYEMLSKAVQHWLISTTSNKRTKEFDEDFRKLFASHLRSLYRAVE